MADFEMRNLHHFPMEKTSYDLKLELLEELDPKEALELMKANYGFRSIYLKDPWRIIGRHVHSIRFTRSNTIEICKLCESTPLDCDPLAHLPLVKKVRNCKKFDYESNLPTQQSIDAARKMLTILDSIGEWACWIDLERFEECFLNFNGQITDRIDLDLTWYSGEEDNPTLSVVPKFFESQLGNCKTVVVDCCVDQFVNIYKLFLKTSVEEILCDFDDEKEFTSGGLEKAIRWIVCNGIPSQNPEAKIWVTVYSPNWQKRVVDAIADFCPSLDHFLSTFPGMEQLPDKGKLRNYRRKFDDERDCVYELANYYFEAFYVPSQAQ